MPNETVDELIEQLKRIRLQESSVLERLTQARRRESNVQRTGYVEGDRVRIHNTIKTPFGSHLIYYNTLSCYRTVAALIISATTIRASLVATPQYFEEMCTRRERIVLYAT
jgi:hypothetical protein